MKPGKVLLVMGACTSTSMVSVRGLLKKAVVQMLEGVQGSAWCSIHLSAFRGRKRKGLTTNVCVS